jgi:hypothetical protein
VVEDDGRVQNLFEIHLVNKHNDTRDFEIVPAEGSTFEYVIAMPTVQLEGGKGMRIPIFVYSAPGDQTRKIALEIRLSSPELRKQVTAPFLRPRGQ